MISQKLALKIYGYNPDTGELTKNRTGKPVKYVAMGDDKYLYLRCRGQLMRAHVLIWLMQHGKIPSENGLQIDHIDGNPRNNALANLRAVTRSENMKNRARQKNNTSGTPGVYFDEEKNKWRAQIRVDGQRIHLGYFDSLALAEGAKARAEREHGFHEHHGKR